LLRPDAPSLFLLQQPEVHLHPKAQAALGSLFCSIASQRRQLIVETHSDYIIDRVRMDIRDKKSDLKPEDVSLLFFEPGELEVKIHSLRFDETGNVLDTPEGYRDFFMTEVRRSIGL
jgi:predicted ATPase